MFDEKKGTEVRNKIQYTRAREVIYYCYEKFDTRPSAQHLRDTVPYRCGGKGPTVAAATAVAGREKPVGKRYLLWSAGLVV